jgi:hypothetical protein
MKLHPSALIENEEYIIEVRDDTACNIKNVYKGKRRINSLDKIDDEGVYNSVWFIDLNLIYMNNSDIKPPKLTRTSNPNMVDLIFQQGKEFILNDKEEEITFYDCYFYENVILPILDEKINILLSSSNNNSSSSENLLCI